MLTGTTLILATLILSARRAWNDTPHKYLGDNLYRLFVEALTLEGNHPQDVEAALTLLDSHLDPPAL